jgi:serine/threonine protein kinase
MSAPAIVEPPVLGAGAELAPGYRVVELVSRGVALDVYEVFSEERLCHCIAKSVRPDRPEQRVRDRLLLEGRLLERLAHPHLARALDTVTDSSGAPVVVLEMILGPTLEELIDSRTRRFAAADLAHLGQHLASALHHVHGAGFLHLDVRPANVVARAGIATLIDLSIARPPGPVRRGLGSREYLSPEQARGTVASAATDVWGLGATLYEAATGTAPFAPHDDEERVTWDAGQPLQLAVAPRDPRTLRPRLGRDLAALVREMLDPVPRRRPALVEVHQRLGRLVEE